MHVRIQEFTSKERALSCDGLGGGVVDAVTHRDCIFPGQDATVGRRQVGLIVGSVGPGGVEMASTQFGSGGGFSALFNRSDAPWQRAAVAKYLAMGAALPKFPPAGSFSPGGRATPDVSALGEGYQVYVDGHAVSVGGTSASAPFFAALVSLLNEARLEGGKPPMGCAPCPAARALPPVGHLAMISAAPCPAARALPPVGHLGCTLCPLSVRGAILPPAVLNPFLYGHPEAFYDVVDGTNAIPRGDGPPLAYGYAAAKGWDAATGLGTPHYDRLLAAAMAAVL